MNQFIEKAKNYAYNAHLKPSISQRYGNQPYSKHLNDVYNIGLKYIYLIDEKYRSDVLAAIFLHDTVEDTDNSPAKIKKEFNFIVADIVYRVSNERGFSRKDKNFKTYPKIWKNNLAIFVKLCDRIANTLNSKNNIDEKAVSMYSVYTNEYPLFRYALKNDLYKEMWNELDSLYI